MLASCSRGSTKQTIRKPCTGGAFVSTPSIRNVLIGVPSGESILTCMQQWNESFLYPRHTTHLVMPQCERCVSQVLWDSAVVVMMPTKGWKPLNQALLGHIVSWGCVFFLIYLFFIIWMWKFKGWTNLKALRVVDLCLVLPTEHCWSTGAKWIICSPDLETVIVHVAGFPVDVKCSVM